MLKSDQVLFIFLPDTSVNLFCKQLYVDFRLIFIGSDVYKSNMDDLFLIVKEEYAYNIIQIYLGVKHKNYAGKKNLFKEENFINCLIHIKRNSKTFYFLQSVQRILSCVIEIP